MFQSAAGPLILALVALGTIGLIRLPSWSARVAALLMMDRLKNWGLFMVQFQATDSVQHNFWHHIDPDHPRYDANAPDNLRDAILDHCRTVDRCIGDILARAGSQTNVLVVSDHGAGPFYEQIHLNVWLWQHGWLRFKRSPITLLRRSLYAAGITPEFMRRHLLRRAPRAARRSILARRYSALALADRVFLSLEDVDWERTRAYSHGGVQGSIYLNLKGRERRAACRWQTTSPFLPNSKSTLGRCATLIRDIP